MIDKQADLHLRINVKSVIGKSLTHALHADNYARERHVPSDPGFETTCTYTHTTSARVHTHTHTQTYRKPLVFFRGVKLPDRVNESTSTYVMRLKQALMRLFP